MNNNEKMLKAVIDSLDYFVVILNQDATLAAVNNSASTIFINNAGCIGNPVWELGLWANMPAAEKVWSESCKIAWQGTRVKFIETIKPSNGDQTSMHFSVAPIKNDSGEVIFLIVEGKADTALPPAFAKGNSTSHAAHFPGYISTIIKSAAAENDIKTRNDVASALVGVFKADQQFNNWLLDSENRFRLMVESIEDYAMFMVDLDGFITSWNRGAERLTGYADVEAIGRHFSMLYPKEELDREHAIHELMMAEKHGRYEEEGVRVRKNGTHYHAQIIVWRIDNSEGNTVGYAKITRDVSALKEAQKREALLFESENRFRLMVESIDDYAMFMVDTKGIIISWNRGAERLTGYSENEVLGHPFSILYPKNELSEEHTIYELTMARTKGHYEEEGIRVRKDGSVYHAQIIIWPVEDKSGEIVSFAKITRDITKRKMAERALKDSEAKFRIMTDAMPQMVWSALPDGRQDYINQQWFHFTGSGSTTDTNKSWLDLVHADDKNQVSSTWHYSLTSGDNFEAQFRLYHTSGVYRWALGRALPVKNEQGKITRWMGTLTDIHEQKRAETALYESARRKDEYLAMLAHELRNPLAPIRNSTALLRRLTTTDSTIIGGLDVIDRQVVHMTRLIDDLLDVARISRGKIELRRETFELGELIQHTASDFNSDYEDKKITLHVVKAAHPIWVFADRTRIAQAIGNLLHNALKFTEAPGEVSVSLTEEFQDGKAFGSVKVKDTGIGIDPTLLDELFEPFVQGNQDLARSKGGLGLGLALIKGFANLHGGRVSVSSAGPGYGSEFIFQIPLSTGIVIGQQPAPTVSATTPLNVVLIDDNRDMVETLAALLSMDGHAIKCAYDGESGLQLIKHEKPDLVLCDIGLPGGRDGYAVARAVREDVALNKTFMVALSGYGQEKDKKLAFECGFDDHLLKPVDFNGLTAMINAAERFSRRQ
ncbi:PAS domain S-box protein [Cellvibrio mixtus]|uniref:PAS domain S-box protein n=1 Tax=Cellvibrio mixtus TaxID=39650 RepID=UPI0006944E2B|nr:PAS domain S-box protein [Cellvibrio mixtus]